MVLIYGPQRHNYAGSDCNVQFRRRGGKIVDERLVAIESSEAGISLRTDVSAILAVERTRWPVSQRCFLTLDGHQDN